MDGVLGRWRRIRGGGEQKGGQEAGSLRQRAMPFEAEHRVSLGLWCWRLLHLLLFGLLRYVA